MGEVLYFEREREGGRGRGRVLFPGMRNLTVVGQSVGIVGIPV